MVDRYHISVNTKWWLYPPYALKGKVNKFNLAQRNHIGLLNLSHKTVGRTSRGSIPPLCMESTMDFKLDKGVGYMYCYNPSHPLANKAGKVYEHRYVMSKHLGRWLTTDEVVHHKDKNKTNNVISNLELTNVRDHAIIHAIENGTVYENRNCEYCNKNFTTTLCKGQRFCSDRCVRDSKKRFDVTSERLNELLWKYPTTHIAKMFGVSDKAIEKRAKKLGLTKPPRGYWAKLNAGKLINS